MHLVTTTQSLEIALAAAVAANQLPFVSSYADETTSAFTPGNQNGQSNNTSTVTALAAPAASTQRILSAFDLYNADTAYADATIRLNDNGTLRTLKRAILAAGESIHYHKGRWRVLTATGAIKQIASVIGQKSSILQPPGTNQGVSSTLAPTSNTSYAIYLGKLGFTPTALDVAFRVTTLASTITWAEVAVATGNPVLGAGANLTTAGFADVSAVINSTGAKAVTVNVSGIRPNDECWLLLGVQASVVGAWRATSVVDDISSGTYLSAAATRPSTMAAATAFALSAANIIWAKPGVR